MKPYLLRIGSCLLASCLWSVSLWSNVQAEEVTLMHDGIELKADYNLQEGQTAKDGVIMLLHGTFAHNRMEIIQTVADQLNEAGYNTLAVNLSFAISQRPDGMLDCAVEHKHQHEDAVTELKAWLGWLQEQGAEKVVAFGHSRGGNQTAWFASEENENPVLEKVVLVAPATWDMAATEAEYAERYKKPLTEVMAAAQALVDAGKGNELMDVPGFVYCEQAKASAASVLSYYRDDERKDTPTLLKKISKPVLVVIGSADDVVKDLPARLEGFTQDNVKIVTIEGADHFFRDLYADDLVEQITEFVGWK